MTEAVIIICSANQWTCFYMITASVMKELNLLMPIMWLNFRLRKKFENSKLSILPNFQCLPSGANSKKSWFQKCSNVLLLSPKIGIYLILGKTRIFLKKVGLSHFSVYWTLNSCRKLGKSNKSILWKRCYRPTDRRTDRTELIWASSKAGGPIKTFLYKTLCYAIYLVWN